MININGALKTTSNQAFSMKLDILRLDLMDLQSGAIAVLRLRKLVQWNNPKQIQTPKKIDGTIMTQVGLIATTM